MISSYDLEQIPLFEQLAPDARQAMAQLMDEVRLEAGETLFEEGSPSDAIYLIASGQVEVSKHLPRAPSAKQLAVLGPGEVLGEMGILRDTPRSATVSAATSTVTYKILKAPFLDLLSKQPGQAVPAVMGLLQILSFRLARTSLDLAVITATAEMLASEPVQIASWLTQTTTRFIGILPDGSFGAALAWNEFNEEFNWLDLSPNSEWLSRGDLSTLFGRDEITTWNTLFPDDPESGEGSCLWAPIGEGTGFLFGHAASNAFRKEDLTLIRSVTRLLAPAVAHAKQVEEQIALTDFLKRKAQLTP